MQVECTGNRLTVTALNLAFCLVERNGLTVDRLAIHPDRYADMRGWHSVFDGMRIWNADIVVDDHATPDVLTLGTTPVKIRFRLLPSVSPLVSL